MACCGARGYHTSIPPTIRSTKKGQEERKKGLKRYDAKKSRGDR
jgi:hypothetical protein